MKYIVPISAIAAIVIIAISAYGLNNLGVTDQLNTSDRITIDKVVVTDPEYVCITAPCDFREVNFSITIHNSVERELGSICYNKYSLKIITGSEWFKTSQDMIAAPCTLTNETIPVGTWSDTYSNMIYLYKEPGSNEHVPDVIDVQIILGNNILTSSVFHLNLKT